MLPLVFCGLCEDRLCVECKTAPEVEEFDSVKYRKVNVMVVNKGGYALVLKELVEAVGNVAVGEVDGDVGWGIPFVCGMDTMDV